VLRVVGALSAHAALAGGCTLLLGLSLYRLAKSNKCGIDWAMRWMTTLWVPLVLALTCDVTSAPPATSPHAHSAVALASTDVAAAALGRENIPGIQVAIVQGGQIILDQGYGVRDMGTRQPLDSNTLFEIGSITKSFTSAAILQLKERGKLKLSDRLG
jgi:CubicO group peptidase (beta-lactamase class C family)